MGILQNILSKIIPHAGAATGTTAAENRPSPLLPNAEIPKIDVDEVLTSMASKNSQKLDWRHSIVDLMKMLDMDSGLDARKTLAKELNYTGDTSDSAKMNIWLHEQVMRKLEENGGTIPASMKH